MDLRYNYRVQTQLNQSSKHIPLVGDAPGFIAAVFIYFYFIFALKVSSQDRALKSLNIVSSTHRKATTTAGIVVVIAVVVVVVVIGGGGGGG